MAALLNTPWSEYTVPFTTAFLGWPKFYTIDGTELRDYYLMRRRVKGQWQYRRLTDEEEIDRSVNAAW